MARVPNCSCFRAVCPIRRSLSARSLSATKNVTFTNASFSRRVAGYMAFMFPISLSTAASATCSKMIDLSAPSSHRPMTYRLTLLCDCVMAHDKSSLLFYDCLRTLLTRPAVCVELLNKLFFKSPPLPKFFVSQSVDFECPSRDIFTIGDANKCFFSWWVAISHSAIKCCTVFLHLACRQLGAF